MSSRDVQRAYDSTSEIDIKLAWMRLGLPSHISDYLISIDSDGKTPIHTPAACTAWTERMRKEMPPEVIDEI